MIMGWEDITFSTASWFRKIQNAFISHPYYVFYSLFLLLWLKPRYELGKLYITQCKIYITQHKVWK